MLQVQGRNWRQQVLVAERGATLRDLEVTAARLQAQLAGGQQTINDLSTCAAT